MKLHSLAAIAIAFCTAFAACSKESYSHDATNLPQKAKTTLSQNFTAAVSLVKVEKSGLGGTEEYEVVLTNGTEITFKANGDWESVETPNNIAVPSGLVPTAITNFVREKHAGALIVGIDKEKNGFDVELSNGLEIKFDKGGNFVAYDK